MRTLTRRRALALLASTGACALGGGALTLIGGGCETPTSQKTDRKDVLADLPDVLILPTYAETTAGAASLAAAVDALGAQPSEATLAAARDAWRAARSPWRRGSSFAIGPTDDLAVTGGAIDEPADAAKIDGLLQGAAPVDPGAVAKLPASARGFLALEYLLFDPTAADLVTRFAGEGGAQRRELAAGLAADLRAKLAAVADGWAPDKGAYAVALRDAGRGSAQFGTERDAFDALLNRALAATDRTIDMVRQASGFMVTGPATPVGNRSDNALADLTNDLQGLQALYACQWAGRFGASLSEVIRDGNPGADDAFRAALDAALAALAAFPGPLRTALPANEGAVAALIERLRAVKAALSTGIFSALGIGVGFNDKDGD